MVSKMDRRKRIAIYGGTFDPVHLGHLEIGRRVSRLFEFDQFLFMPAREAPHKVGQGSAAALDRYAMLALATQSEPHLSVSRFELEGPGRQYTIDTLRHFKSANADSDLFFVMGADSWAEIATWREWKSLLNLSNVVVVTRPGQAISAQMPDGTNATIIDLQGGITPPRETLADSRPKVFLTDAVVMDISSTAVRRAAGNGGELEQLVPGSVAEYIGKYRLYQKQE